MVDRPQPGLPPPLQARRVVVIQRDERLRDQLPQEPLAVRVADERDRTVLRGTIEYQLSGARIARGLVRGLRDGEVGIAFELVRQRDVTLGNERGAGSRKTTQTS